MGSAVTRDLVEHGHEVLGLARSQESASAVERIGAEALRGDLTEPEALRAGVARCHAVVHAGFLHDFTRFAEACAIDRDAIDVLGTAIGTTGKPMIVTAGLAFLDVADRLALETDRALAPSAAYPRASEEAAAALSARGVPTGVMRLPPSVHGVGDHGFVPALVDIARRSGRSVYIGEGTNAWPAVHVSDAARAFRLAVEKGTTGATFHAVGETGVPFRAIAEAIAEGLDVPCVSLSVDEARAHFGWLYNFASINQPASSDQTRVRLGCFTQGPELLTDIRTGGYFPSAAADRRHTAAHTLSS